MGLAQGARGRDEAETSLDELRHLAESAGATIVGSLLQERRRPDAATLIGSGKLSEVARAVEEQHADLVLFDEALSPAQQRNVERALHVKALDRTQLILDIFARRARSREGRLQVELAQLDYLLPRLAGQGALLSRLGAGIGTRGPGETKLETDRRRVRERIRTVRREIELHRRRRATHRQARARTAAPTVALVGYTNAGKSTLFNALTEADTAVSEQLFMTLDPLVRRCPLGGESRQHLLLVDTVGFIRKLPHQLVAAFRATLEEVARADLLLHVADANSEDLAGQEAAVEAVLQEIHAAERPRLRVLNQIDRLEPARRHALAAADPTAVLVSARTGAGLAHLRQAMGERLGLSLRSVGLRFARDDRRGVAAVYRLGRVLSHEIVDGEVHLAAELPVHLLARYRGYLL